MQMKKRDTNVYDSNFPVKFDEEAVIQISAFKTFCLYSFFLSFSLIRMATLSFKQRKQEQSRGAHFFTSLIERN